MAAARIILLVTSPRLPAGLMTAGAWDAVRENPVFSRADGEQATALRVSGVPVTVLEPDPDLLLAELAGRDAVVWLAGPDGDQGFARSLGLRLTRNPELADLELMYGSWDPPGARLLDAVAVIDRLLAPGGDPWKRAQDHRTLAPYLLEESYEAYDAMMAGDLGELREELGDVLLQVVLHARLASELPEEDAWNVDDVAAGLVEKMIRRNPHVFAGERLTGLDEITESWERIKRAEKSRDSVLDGIALSQPALSLAGGPVSTCRCPPGTTRARRCCGSSRASRRPRRRCGRPPRGMRSGCARRKERRRRNRRLAARDLGGWRGAENVGPCE
jgi:XTP/dITP diphosphohydrolase